MTRSPGLSFVLVAALGLALASSAAAQVATTTPDPEMAAVFAGASALPQVDLMPKPTLKCGLVCLPVIKHTTATISGSGSTCANATSSLNAQLRDLAISGCSTSFDGTCNIVDHYTTACTLIAPGTYQIQGYATYSCSINNC